NAAGPIMAVYLLSLRLPKNSFIGTAAYFFLLINLFKVPFHILSWKTITLETLTLNLWALPVILVGFWLGVRIVKRIPEQAFRYFVMIMTGLVAIKLLIG
ncbi:MAG: TSUP family transporter, partial [Bacteroidota bacterium]